MTADYEELVATLNECAEMVGDGSNANLTKFWHLEAAKVTSQACEQAATAITELLAERDGCDPDGCKEHIDAFMRRAEAAEAERDAMAVQLAAATNPEYLASVLERVGVCDIEWQHRAEAAKRAQEQEPK